VADHDMTCCIPTVSALDRAGPAPTGDGRAIRRAHLQCGEHGAPRDQRRRVQGSSTSWALRHRPPTRPARRRGTCTPSTRAT
jgi:hypothetical protein